MSRKHLVPKHRKYPDHPLRKEMDKKGMTAKEFAKYTGINAATLFNIMSHRYSYQQRGVIQTIADACGMTYEEAKEICS